MNTVYLVYAMDSADAVPVVEVICVTEEDAEAYVAHCKSRHEITPWQVSKYDPATRTLSRSND